MQWRDRLGMYAIVTTVAVLIWLWAAFETRERAELSFSIKLEPAAAGEQVVTPTEMQAKVTFTGSALAVDEARKLHSQGPIRLTVGAELPSQPGVYRMPIEELLAANDDFSDTGVSIVSVDPTTTDLTIDGLVPITLPVRAVLPGVETEDDPEVVPAQVTVHLPSRLLDRTDTEELNVEAQVLQTRLERLEPGVQNTLTAKLRLPASFASEKSVRINPPTAQVKFAVKSRIKETTLSTVVVQLAGPDKDHEEFPVEILDRTLPDVTIRADVELMRKIEQTEEAIVVALVHVSSKDKDDAIDSKPITCFMVLPRDETSDVTPTLVQAEVNGSTEVPTVRLRITPREKAIGD